MKIKHFFIGAGVSLALALGVGLAAAPKEAVKAEATVMASGVITIDATGGSWATNAGGQKFSVKFTDGGTNEGWGSFVTGAQSVYLIEVPYELEFTPTKMTAYRYNPSKTELDWASNKETSVWNKSSELTYTANGNIIIGAWDTDHNSASVGYFDIQGKSNETGWEWTNPLASFNKVKLNGSNHAEYYGTFNFTQWEEFVINVDGNWYKYDQTTISSNLDSTKWVSKDGNVQYTGTAAIDIAIYFDRNGGSIFINEPAAALSDEFAQVFLKKTNGYCTASISSSVQTYLKGEYDALASTAGAQKAFYDSDVKRGKGVTYDTYSSEALSRYVNMQEEKGYTDFLGLGVNNKANTRINIPTLFTQESNNNYAWIIAVIGVASLVAVGGFFFIRKRKENN